LGRAAAGAAVALGVFASVAQAHDVRFSYTPGSAAAGGGCGSITYTYSNFNLGQNSTVETQMVTGGPLYSKTFTFTAPAPVSGQNVFDGSDTWAVIGGSTGQTVTAGASWTAATAHGAAGSGSATFKLVCPAALVYTGRAYNADVKLTTALGIHQEVGPVHDSGSISTPNAESASSSAIPITGSPLTIGVLNWSYTTGGGSSMFEADTDQVAVASLLGLPTVGTGEVKSTSTTTCTNGVLSSLGSTYIAKLVIGSTEVVGPDPGAILPVGYYKNKAVVVVPGLVSVVLGEQLPITDGLAVNGIDVKLNGLGLVGVQVIVSHAESDVENC
jgi:hypothetical protein